MFAVKPVPHPWTDSGPGFTASFGWVEVSGARLPAGSPHDAFMVLSPKPGSLTVLGASVGQSFADEASDLGRAKTAKFLVVSKLYRLDGNALKPFKTVGTTNTWCRRICKGWFACRQANAFTTHLYRINELGNLEDYGQIYGWPHPIDNCDDMLVVDIEMNMLKTAVRSEVIFQLHPSEKIVGHTENGLAVVYGRAGYKLCDQSGCWTSPITWPAVLEADEIGVFHTKDGDLLVVSPFYVTYCRGNLIETVLRNMLAPTAPVHFNFATGEAIPVQALAEKAGCFNSDVLWANVVLDEGKPKVLVTDGFTGALILPKAKKFSAGKA